MLKRVLFWVSPFVLGLGIAFGGAQLLSSDSSPARAVVTTAQPAVTDTTSVDSSNDLSPISSQRPADSDAELSPLATRVRPLGSAFPDDVLAGLGDPIGVRPLRISIDSLDVAAAPIDPVGIEDNGELEIPGAEAVGWYRFGAGVGGGQGSTVLAAHIAFNGVDGVFRDLSAIDVGAAVSITDETGRAQEYRVTDVIQFSKTTLPIADLFREDGSERLVLITCGGDFNPSLLSYDDNVVAIAEPA